ncbi:hypothetical protein JKP88DRAFT_244915 [Tribonema minus]|uniref:Uncharacterized protein n=1 Tax=Tribonema minus TaxID=303371 RepID=A0A836CEZ9_9STRA|nr:hypothetical protein JKP88DRAFT_244915 [Tribonema minus]
MQSATPELFLRTANLVYDFLQLQDIAMRSAICKSNRDAITGIRGIVRDGSLYYSKDFSHVPPLSSSSADMYMVTAESSELLARASIHATRECTSTTWARMIGQAALQHGLIPPDSLVKRDTLRTKWASSTAKLLQDMCCSADTVKVTAMEALSDELPITAKRVIIKPGRANMEIKLPQGMRISSMLRVTSGGLHDVSIDLSTLPLLLSELQATQWTSMTYILDGVAVGVNWTSILMQCERLAVAHWAPSITRRILCLMITTSSHADALDAALERHFIVSGVGLVSKNFFRAAVSVVLNVHRYVSVIMSCS